MHDGGICQETMKSAFCGELQVGLGLALVYKPKLFAKKFGLYISMELYGLLLWKGMCVCLCVVDIAYLWLSD